MIEFIVAVDPRPNTKARHFVSVAQALGRGLIRPCCHARKRDRFSAHRKYQQILDRLDLLRHVAPPFTHFFPRRAQRTKTRCTKTRSFISLWESHRFKSYVPTPTEPFSALWQCGQRVDAKNHCPARASRWPYPNGGGGLSADVVA